VANVSGMTYAAGEPNNALGAENCLAWGLAMTAPTDFHFADRPCDSSNKFICEVSHGITAYDYIDRTSLSILQTFAPECAAPKCTYNCTKNAEKVALSRNWKGII
jgi:hypothetical protein